MSIDVGKFTGVRCSCPRTGGFIDLTEHTDDCVFGHAVERELAAIKQRDSLRALAWVVGWAACGNPVGWPTRVRLGWNQ